MGYAERAWFRESGARVVVVVQVLKAPASLCRRFFARPFLVLF